MFFVEDIEPEAEELVKERETYAIGCALDPCQSLVKGREIHVFCDHKKTMFKNATGKLQRWTLRLADFNP